MNFSKQSNTRKGFIIVITLIILLVMTTMGIGMFYSTKQTAKQVSISGNRAESLYTAESCITEAVHWIEIESAKGGPPCQSEGAGNLCKSIENRHMGEWKLSGENKTQSKRMNAHRYRCDISLLGTISSDSDTSTKYLYKIKARADGSNNVVSEVEIIASIIFTPIEDSPRLYSGSERYGGIRIYDTVTKKGIDGGGIHSPPISALAFGPDGLLYSGFHPKRRIWIYDPVAKIEIGSFPTSLRVSALAFGPDGLLYSGNRHGSGIGIHDPKAKIEVGYIPTSANISALAFGPGPDGLLYSGNVGIKSISIYDPKAKIEVGYIPTSTNIPALAFGPDGLLYSGSLKGGMHAYDTDTKKRVRIVGEGSVTLAFGPDGLLYYSPSQSRIPIRIKDPVENKWVGDFRGIDVGSKVYALAFDNKRTGREAKNPKKKSENKGLVSYESWREVF